MVKLFILLVNVMIIMGGGVINYLKWMYSLCLLFISFKLIRKVFKVKINIVNCCYVFIKLN